MKTSIKLIGSLFLISILIVSCKKNYTCVCTNPGGAQNAFTTKATKNDAQEECAEYYDLNYGYYFSETSCEIK